MPPKPKEVDQVTALRMLTEGLRSAALNPNMLSYKPHAKQEKFHRSTKRRKLYIGGNRSGKSVGGVLEDIWWLTGKHPYRETPAVPVRGRVVTVDFKHGVEQIIKPLFAQWLPKSELKGGSWEKAYSRELNVLTLANGSTCEFMSYEQALEKFAGTSRHFVHCDEEPPKDIWEECMARLIDTAGDAWITMTPVEGMTWVHDDLYLPGKEGSELIDIIEIEMTENPYIAEAEADMFMAGLSRDDRIARGKGKFVTMGGVVFKQFDKQVHVIEPFTPPFDWEWYVSVDHGFNNPTAILWHAVSPTGKVFTFAEHYEAEKTIDYHAGVFHTRNNLFGRVPDYVVGDPAMSQRNAVTGVSIFDEYAKYGVHIVPSNNDVAAGVAIMNRYLNHENGSEPLWKITENCSNLIWEMGRLRWKKWANKKMSNENNKYDTIHKKDDHACDSARYLFTFIPHLEPQKQEGPQKELYLPEGFHAANQSQSTDWRLINSGSTEWSYESMDETLGGIW
jgi:phage terminase large subunit-like protein